MPSWNPVNWFMSGDYDSSSTGPDGKNSGVGWIARNVYVDDEEEQLYADLQKQNEAKLDEQFEDGKIGPVRYYQNSSLNNSLTDGYEDLGNKGVGGLFKLVPWYVWVLGALALFFYLGGFSRLKGVLKK